MTTWLSRCLLCAILVMGATGLVSTNSAAHPALVSGSLVEDGQDCGTGKSSGLGKCPAGEMTSANSCSLAHCAVVLVAIEIIEFRLFEPGHFPVPDTAIKGLILKPEPHPPPFMV
ncbi:MAG: hypothetical protein HN725_00940 [Alphaproteobacteria bacterium]|nr:hypothetical protein [Alphaproteobacteria bacterium]MBT4083236.1 hypothetical protein [Alphaproteobacteria bacterium]MBT4544268.1 hypothetical protein [Alphaproteobacteria bacterium]MBT7743825.1 hypothetical protein [Alphaproteobacteria bacterium]